jgi:hypothetical protein
MSRKRARRSFQTRQVGLYARILARQHNDSIQLFSKNNCEIHLFPSAFIWRMERILYLKQRNLHAVGMPKVCFFSILLQTEKNSTTFRRMVEPKHLHIGRPSAQVVRQQSPRQTTPMRSSLPQVPPTDACQHRSLEGRSEQTQCFSAGKVGLSDSGLWCARLTAHAMRAALLPLLLTVLASSWCALASAAPNATDTFLYRVGFSLVDGSPTTGVKRTTKLATPRDDPRPDVEPEGFTIYDHLAELPEYDIQPGDAEPEKCYVESRKYCVKASFCGHVCEPVRIYSSIASRIFCFCLV